MPAMHALRPVRYVPEREATLPASERTRFKGALRDWEIPASDQHPPLTLRVAYIHSSEEAAQVADARDRALHKAEDALERLRNGLGGRYYKTREQVERRIGQILGINIAGLIDVTVSTRAGKLTVTWQRNQRRDRRPLGRSMGSTPWRRTSPGASAPDRCYASTKTSRSSNVATAT